MFLMIVSLQVGLSVLQVQTRISLNSNNYIYRCAVEPGIKSKPLREYDGTEDAAWLNAASNTQ